ncbi:MAG: DNA polymerase I [Chloroflexi bacterium]|nr:MAG: DNA polymerase I [Chloroflexota bacterium]HDN79144.1 DNA polymerase I [Chloroflexota bacterium]
MKKLVIVDGHALAFRAYHALPLSMSTSKGEPTNAVYGFTSMLLNVLKEEKPDYIAVAFDTGKSFRHEEFTEYKANRAKMGPDLDVQIKRIYQIVEALGVKSIGVKGYEADDILGTLARKAAEQGIETLIVTGDTDAFQLIGPKVRVLTSGRRFSDTIVYDREKILARYGLEPHQLIDYKALVGDKTDNIPGVKGIGEKTAAKLLRKYGSLENIYRHLDEITPPRLKEILAQNRDRAFLNKDLVTIRTNVPLDVDLESLRYQGYDEKKVKEIFRELEFRTLFKRLPERGEEVRQLSFLSKVEVHPKPELGHYEAVQDEQALNRLVGKLSEASAIALDVETTDVNPMRAELVGLSLTTREGEGYYIPVGHREGEQLPWEVVRGKLRPILEDETIPKYAHHAKYDMLILLRNGITVKGLTFDTMVAGWLVDPTGRHVNLKELAWKYLGVEMTPIEDLIGKGKSQITMDLVPISRATPYAAADVDMTYRLVKVLGERLKELGLEKLFYEVEMPLVPVLMDMEMTGVKLDVDFLKEMSRELSQRLGELEEEIYRWVGYRFNVNSSRQLSEALFGKLGISAQGIPKTKSGHYSTSADVLEKLRGRHPVVELLLEHRHLAKIKSTYADALPKMVNPATGRVHTSYNQTGTVTGRLSSSEPNLQNIPTRTDVGKAVRKAFIAEEGWLLLSADYSQVELRILAHITGDEGLLEAFRKGEDIHASTASAILDVPIDQVTPDMRRLAKTVNFGIIYGMSAYGLAEQTGLTPEEAHEFIQNYFARYPKVKEYVETTKAKARQEGYVETLLGRRRYFPELAPDSKAHHTVKAAAERMAINAPIQGSAADIIKIAMVRLHKALKERKLRSRIILQVHDELVLEVPEEEMKEVPSLVKQVMEGAYELKAPLKVDLEVGKNWGELKEIQEVEGGL